MIKRNYLIKKNKERNILNLFNIFRILIVKKDNE